MPSHAHQERGFNILGDGPVCLLFPRADRLCRNGDYDRAVFESGRPSRTPLPMKPRVDVLVFLQKSNGAPAMDLGITGRWAIVCASSKGLGKGCAMALAREGVNLVINSRGKDALDETASELRARHPTIEVRAVAGDVSDKDTREMLLSACPQVDILVNNAGGPPPGDFRDWEEADWYAALNTNMLTPIALIRAVVDSMAERRFGRIVNITSAAVKAPIDVLGLSNGARSGLTGFIAGLARQSRLAGCNVTINNLLPGAFETERLHKTLEASSAASSLPLADITDQRREAIPARRFGSIQEFGAYCAFLCSTHAGYQTGQNLLLDGGSYPGTF